jgi:endonuclease/exonuclease/phosphatase family metal-dependent hydrolase
MKLLTWNVNHRASRKRIPSLMGEALAWLSPDVIVLTEYVPGPSHENFMAELVAGGFAHMCMSHYTPKENHVFIAARTDLVLGTIKGPPIAPSVPSNVLHVHLKGHGLDIVGLRVPDYSKQPPIRHACWDWLETITRSVREQPFVFMGDFNVDPSYSPNKCGDRIGKLVASGWQHAAPSSGVSYWPVAGGTGKRLDHAFVSKHFVVRNTEYIWESGNYVFAGKTLGAMSDHAALLIEIDRNLSNSAENIQK